MKLKIKIKELTEGCMPVIMKKGDWIDLRAAQDIELKAPQAGVQYQRDNQKYRDVEIPVAYIPLGIAVKLPDGFEAIVASRSSNPKKFGIFIPNGQGIIDNSYSGNGDQWYYIAASMENTTIKKGNRICQFRIQLSQKATVWQKLRWLFSSGIEIVQVNNLKDKDRGGLGSTGKG
ncbi:MAG: dUTP diphosphatase [Clostridium sp.]